MSIRRTIHALAALVALAPPVWAQSSPGLIQHQVPTATQWNSYFSSKADNLQTATGSTTPRTLANRAAEVVNVLDYGADATGATASTTAFQAAINAAQGNGASGLSLKKLVIPAGSYKTGPLTVTRSIEIIGDGEKTSSIQLVTGSTAPMFTVATAFDVSDYYAGGNPPAEVTFRGLRLFAASNTDPPGLNLAHGISVQTASVNPVYVKLVIDHVVFDHFPGNGLDGTGLGANGFGVVTNSYFIASQNNLFLNSNFDWRLSNSDFSQAAVDNIVLTGAAGIVFFACNSYTAARYDVSMFQSSGSPGVGRSEWIGGAIDTAGQHGVWYNMLGARSPFAFIGTHFANNGHAGAAGTYSDIYIPTGANGDLRLEGVSFAATNASIASANNWSLWNIQWQTSTAPTVAIDNVWLEGTVATSFQVPGNVLGSYSVSGSGTTGGNLAASTLAVATGNATGTLPAATLANGSFKISILPSVTGGGFNPLVQGNDGVIFQDVAGANNTGALFVGPHSGSSIGLRFTSAQGNLDGTVIGNTTPAAGAFTSVSTTSGVKYPIYTVSGLPTCGAGQAGTLVAVSDATAPTYNVALTGGGAVKIPVYCNGTAWTAH